MGPHSADLRQRIVTLYEQGEGSIRQFGEPYWMPAIGLGIGRDAYLDGSVEREALYWYTEQGKRYLTPEEQLARYCERFGELPE